MNLQVKAQTCFDLVCVAFELDLSDSLVSRSLRHLARTRESERVTAVSERGTGNRESWNCCNEV